jgi:hypothetical protein
MHNAVQALILLSEGSELVKMSEAKLYCNAIFIDRANSFSFASYLVLFTEGWKNSVMRSSTISNLLQTFLGLKNQGGGACSPHRGTEKFIQNFG